MRRVRMYRVRWSVASMRERWSEVVDAYTAEDAVFQALLGVQGAFGVSVEPAPGATKERGPA